MGKPEKVDRLCSCSDLDKPKPICSTQKPHLARGKRWVDDGKDIRCRERLLNGSLLALFYPVSFPADSARLMFFFQLMEIHAGPGTVDTSRKDTDYLQIKVKECKLTSSPFFVASKSERDPEARKVGPAETSPTSRQRCV